jgi:hypothetical protein
MLREKATEMGAIDGDVHAHPIVEGNGVNRVVGEATLEQRSCGSDDPWVLGVE